jgi:indoleamine 2,3-dioxygenase
MKSFRSAHIQMVSVYIITQANKKRDAGAQDNTAEKMANGLLARGTGGTDLIPFLKRSRTETENAMILE